MPREQPLVGALAPTIVADRYRVLERIGEGGLGVVYRVEDVAENAIRALKIMPRASGRANLRGEFAALARLHHENVVRVHDYGVTETGDDYFTMEYLAGGTLTEAAPPASDPRFYRLIGGVLRALAFLHARGLVHADIKPSNILIDAEAVAQFPARAAKLVDFGLAARTADPASAAARGTFRYAAPEVYAGRLDLRSDLYSFGVLLYELLTGKPAYPGNDVLAVIRAQRLAPPVDPRHHDASIPAALAELVMALTEPEPAARLQTADEALARVNDMSGTNFGVSADKPRIDLSGALVGRDEELASLAALWDGIRGDATSPGAVALLLGEEGVGKSRLIGELKLHVQLGGSRWYAASARNQLGTPYAGLAEVVRAVFVDFKDRVDASWDAALAPLWTARSAATPRRRERTTSHAEGESAAWAAEMGQTRFGMAERVATFLIEASRHEPLALAIDDLHAAERGTQEMFAYLGRAAAAGRILIVGAADARADALVRGLENAQRFEKLPLRPLTVDHVRRLVDSMLGEDVSRRISDSLFRSSGGNPAYLARIVNELVERDVLGRQRGRWVVLDEGAAIPMPMDAVVAAEKRLGGMPKRTRKALESAAVLGERFDLDTLVQVCGAEQTSDEVSQAVVDATAARLLETATDEAGFRFLHRGVRDAIYASVPEKRRAKLHTQAARILEAQQAAGRQVSPAILAEHYLAVGATEEGIGASLAAADDYRLARNYHAARDWYARAAGLLVASPGRDLARVLERLADMAGAIGDVDAACDTYRRATEQYGEDVSSRVRVATRLAEILRRQGATDAAIHDLMAALALARSHRLPADEAACHYAVSRVHMYGGNYPQAAEHAAAGLVLARAANSHNLAALILKTRADIETFRGDSRAALLHVEAAVAESVHAGPLTQADTFHTRGRASIHAGDYLRAIESLERAIAVYQANGRVEPEAKSLNNLGAACYFQGDWERAQTSWERFLQLCERLNDTQELVIGLSNLGCLYRDRGQFTEAIKLLERARVLAERIGRPHSVGLALGNLGEIHFRQGELDMARELYAKCMEIFQSIGAKEDLIETRRRIVELDIAEGEVDRALDSGVDIAREAQELAARLEEGILHRVIASALRQHGDLESAHWFLEKGREILSSLGARYEIGKVDLESAELLIAMGRTQAGKAQLQKAQETFSSLGARWDLARVRRAKQDAILAEPRTVSGDLSQHVTSTGLEILLDIARQSGRMDLEKLLEVVLERILEVTQFERGFILLLDERGRPTERKRANRVADVQEFEGADADFSASVVRRVAQTGQPVAVTNIADDDALKNQASVVALGLRSVMCAPMRRKGRVVGIVYVDSRHLAGEHKAGDLALLEALASHAAIAIENAQLVTEEQRKTELMGILAHEIRNPLAGILGFSELMPDERKELPEDAVLLVDRIHRHAQRLKRIVDNILELARVEAGKVEWSMTPVAVFGLLDDVRESYAAIAEKSGVTLAVEAPNGLPRALGNADRLFQVLSNLLGNALKFTPKGGRVTLAASVIEATGPVGSTDSNPDLAQWTPVEEPSPTGAYLRIDVRDTGCGISKENQARLFEKFVQVQGARMSHGVGLGLFISRDIVGRHGGRIWVESEPGHGTTFSFTLPCIA